MSICNDLIIVHAIIDPLDAADIDHQNKGAIGRFDFNQVGHSYPFEE